MPRCRRATFGRLQLLEGWFPLTAIQMQEPSLHLEGAGTLADLADRERLLIFLVVVICDRGTLRESRGTTGYPEERKSRFRQLSRNRFGIPRRRLI